MPFFGSAPRVRGTPPEPELPLDTPRFSPAGAGNARHSAATVPYNPVQPRGCGERHRFHYRHISSNGSAPRVRGTPRPEPQSQAGDRFSPAGAGNASARPPSGSAVAVQPRGCGERATSRTSVARIAGSAPRVRGTRNDRAGYCEIGRFSPAGAGNAFFLLARTENPAVQPRGCGERLCFSDAIETQTGSAPRVRGTRCCAIYGHQTERFSPAGAGNAKTPILSR